MKPKTQRAMPPQPNIFSLFNGYKKFVVLLTIFTIAANFTGLLAPKIIAGAIDSYTHGTFDMRAPLIQFVGVAVLVFIFTCIQSIIQTYASETVARDMRQRLADKISEQSYMYVVQTTPSSLLTNLTSDIDAVKMFVGQALGMLIASYALIVGASLLLLITNWKLALAVLLIIPLIMGTRAMVQGKIRALFMQTQQVLDWLNRVINESILGAALIRVLNSQNQEHEKFAKANAKARDLRLQIVGYFAILIPIITFVAGLAVLTIVALGGSFVIWGSMSLGDIAAVNSYVGVLIFPLIMIGFLSNIIAQSAASYGRISAVLNSTRNEPPGTVPADLGGTVDLSHVSLRYGQKHVLKDISLTLKPGTRTAIIGPTAAGKTQLLYVLNGLVKATQGAALYAGTPLEELEKESFHRQMGFVFQDSIIFNMSIRENIAFSEHVTEKDVKKAVETAELSDFVRALPKKLDTVVSERGTTLSGGQKQRIMLARALAMNPKVLLLDDFTARVDTPTEKKILANIEKNYPGVTLVSVTQKISSVMDYDQCVLMMEGEVIAVGTHAHLLKTSPEYVQLYESQKSTTAYEIHA